MTLYYQSIVNDIENLEKGLFDGLTSNPLLRKCDISKCEAMCCYDGVYLQDDEEVTIVQFVEQNKELFTHLPEDYIVNGNWKDLVSGRKTAVRSHKYFNDNFPSHFEQTRCVFALNTGECSLQRVATDLNLHPWKVKPKTCWSFPNLSENPVPLAPPTIDESDPYAVDASYPGYVKFVSCGQARLEGDPWFKVCKQEILYSRLKETPE
jgi:hypothetical protein